MGLFRKLQHKPALFLSTTGMRRERFEQLMPEFERIYRQLEAQRKSCVVKTGQERQRQPGGGAQFSTELAERASKTVVALAEKETNRRKGRIGNLEDFNREYPELSILIDGTEQPKQRPQDKQKRKSDYSGKKKRHTLKQIITATSKGIILDQSPSVGGRCHDFRAFKAHVADGEAGRALLEQFRSLRVVATTDSGFTGINKLSLPISTHVVERARRGHPLTSEQKVLNRVRSRERIQVEHTIGRRKKYRIASSVYRNADKHYDGAMNIVGGLVNLRAYDRIEQATGIDLLTVGI